MDVVDKAELLIEAERDEGVARARRSLLGAGGSSCATCGNEIAPARRAALPSAVRCAPCQAAMEGAPPPRRVRGPFEVFA